MALDLGFGGQGPGDRNLRVRVWGSRVGVRVLESGAEVSGIRVSCFWLRISGIAYRVSHFGYRISGIDFGSRAYSASG